MRGWQANKKRTCAQPAEDRAMPENEIPPIYGWIFVFLARKVETLYKIWYTQQDIIWFFKKKCGSSK